MGNALCCKDNTLERPNKKTKKAYKRKLNDLEPLAIEKIVYNDY